MFLPNPEQPVGRVKRQISLEKIFEIKNKIKNRKFRGIPSQELRPKNSVGSQAELTPERKPQPLQEYRKVEYQAYPLDLKSSFQYPKIEAKKKEKRFFSKTLGCFF